ncbi:nucleotide/sugar transporter family protein [Striga asiatica]|uniref:Nucleotide/sugar transporter family protein n=1 Tax=Striga asiatica TaxID=4170 RepID=A0A5A7PSR1_STRAF|nr:nucleotide/sugar transporter family protein [Striga asiatica]
MAQTLKRGSVLPMVLSRDPSPEFFKSSAMTKAGALAAIFYMACAVLLMMFNKAALSSYSFPCANVITLCQMICSCCFLYMLRSLNLISFTTNESETSKSAYVPIRTFFTTAPISLTYLLYMLASMESVRSVNVPMYTALRRTTIILTMMLEYVLVRQRYTRCILGSVVLIMLGAFVAGSRDFSFDSYGYIVVFMSNITTSVYLTTIARIGKSSGLNSFGLMWCNGILCGIVLSVWTFVSGDLETIMNFPYLRSPGFLVMYINHDVFTVLLGWAIFGGLPFDLLNVVGQLIGFLGSAMYAYYKLTGQ